jgi:hypothetical protein
VTVTISDELTTVAARMLGIWSKDQADLYERNSRSISTPPKCFGYVLWVTVRLEDPNHEYSLRRLELPRPQDVIRPDRLGHRQGGTNVAIRTTSDPKREIP